MTIPFIDLNTQYEFLKPQIMSRIETVLKHGQYIMGPEVNELEEFLQKYTESKHCVTVANGTESLLISLMALGIKRGDEVITTPFSFISPSEMIALLGAKPVFVDIDIETYNIDPNKIESAITQKTKAIIPVSLFGQCADMESINAIANKYNLPVIEDAAQSFGAIYKGKKSCSLSTIGSTSFFPSKPLGAYGDGGALFTNDDTLAKAMREIRKHGQNHRFHHSRIGLNGRLDTIQAAIILAKLEHFDWEVAQRQKIGARYTTLLKERCQEIETPFIELHNKSVYAQYTIRVKRRENILKKLSKAGIRTSVYYPLPLSLQPVFSQYGYKFGDFSKAENAAQQVISLPMGPYLDEADQLKIIEVLAAAT